MRDNKERSEWAREAMDAIYEDDTEGNVGDILADIMHLCRQEGIDFEARLKTARMNFEAETTDNDNQEAGPEETSDAEKYPIEDWKYEVRNGDTLLGYNEWLEHRKEADQNDD